VIGLAAACFASCAPAPPTAQEVATMNAAPKPSSQQAAQKAIIRYFERTLFDAEAARYRFPLSPTQGSLRTEAGVREFGWFMCGEINGKNRMGAYTGYKTFLAYFSPTSPDEVTDGTIADTDEFGLIDGWCKGLYGLNRR
jgi:hypothetical protein